MANDFKVSHRGVPHESVGPRLMEGATTTPNEKKITVLKFGGSVLRDENDLPSAVQEIYRHWRHGEQVLAVVSAFGGTTDALLERAQAISDDPDPEALATLLLTGEATSAAMLGLALKRAGLPTKILSPEQVGILTDGDQLDSHPIEADVIRLTSELEKAVVVVSGFAGVRSYGDLTLLGRGGTDYTALFLAQKLDAKCLLVKDVKGLYESNPATGNNHPRQFSHASYQTTLGIGGELVQPKAVRFAEQHDLRFEIVSYDSNNGTTIGHVEDRLVESSASSYRPLRVALLGCGTVGGGVYQRLAAQPDKFKIVGVVNLSPDKAVAAGVDRTLLAHNAKQLIESDCDVVIELIGGFEPARSLISHALFHKRHVITANKALLSADAEVLDRLAQDNGVTIQYSASVGGAMPALETVADLKTKLPHSIRGIVNGTCNFICDQLASGIDFDAAVLNAQSQGFAEADPTLDLDGTDAAQKLILLARAAFGTSIPLASIKRVGIKTLSPAKVKEAFEKGLSYRLIAECKKTSTGFEASVRPVELPHYDAFAQTKGAENCLVIESENGVKTTIRGRGAGRFATTEAVMADLHDIRTIFLNQNNVLAKEAHV